MTSPISQSELTHILELQNASLGVIANMGYAATLAAQHSLKLILRWISYKRENEDTGGFYDLVVLPRPLTVSMTVDHHYHYVRTIVFPENLDETYVQVYESAPISSFRIEQFTFSQLDRHVGDFLLTSLADPTILHDIIDHLLTVLLPPADTAITENELQ